jgi:hypothetical protein
MLSCDQRLWRWTVRMTLMLMIAVLALSGQSRPQPGASGPQCRAVTFTANLKAGNSFAQKVDGLEFRIRATNGKGTCNGWTFTFEDADGHDFIYPVNFPLRFNPSQLLDCSYGLTAKQGLEMKRSMRFILTEQDYLRLDPLMKDALWPADSPDPKHAGERYLSAIRSVQTGLIRLNTQRYELSPDGIIRSATFRVDLIAPTSFHFDPALKPYSTACPATPAQ